MRTLLDPCGIMLALLLCVEVSEAQEVFERYGGRAESFPTTSAVDAQEVDRLQAYRAMIDTWRLVDRGYGRPLYELRYVRAGVPEEEGACGRPSEEVEEIGRGDSRWPDSATNRFVILADAGAEIFMLEETLLSCTGDITRVVRHYFDRDRRTFLFEEVSFFDAPPCSGTEVIRYYFKGDGGLLAKWSSMVDGIGRVVSSGSCPGMPNYEIGANYDAVLMLRLRGMSHAPG